MANYATTIMYCEKPDENLLAVAEHFVEIIDVKQFCLDLGENLEEIILDARTDITSVCKMSDEYNSVRVEAQTPWSEDKRLIRVLRKHCARVYWESCEETSKYFVTNDSGARHFSERFKLLTEGAELDYLYEGDLVKAVKGFFPELECCETYDEILECEDIVTDENNWLNVMRIDYV